MTPAIRAAEKAGVKFEVLEYLHDAAAESYGLEAAQALGLDPGRVFKTLVVQTDRGELAVGVVPVSHSLDLKAMAHTLASKKAAMAEAAVAERTTGYVVGGISPLGQRKQLTTVIDASAEALDHVCVSAGRRGLQIRLAPGDLARLTRATFAPIAR